MTLLPTPTTEPDTGNGHARNLGKEARLLPTPTTSDTNGAGAHGDGGTDLRTTVARMLPTPTSRDWKDHTIRREPHRPDDTDTLARALTGVPCALPSGCPYCDAHFAGEPCSEHAEPERLLPTPHAGMAERGASNPDRRMELNSKRIPQLDELATVNRWGDYAAAINRWEQILGRPAPAPTMTSAKGNPQLSPRFVEWMMGLPEGWVDDVPGLTRNEKLKALGNGVVSQQAVEAVLRLLALGSEVAA